jgi:predicted alpha-1,6-mannanase (GH76 family)
VSKVPSSFSNALGCVALGLLSAACGADGGAMSSVSGAGGAPGGSSNGGAGAITSMAGAGNVSGASAGGATAAGNGGAAQAGSGGGSTITGGASGAAGAGPVTPEYPFPPLITGCKVPAAQANADSALGATLASFWSGADQYVRATSPSNGKLAGVGTYAQILDAVLDGVQRTGGKRFSGLIRALYEGQSSHGFSSDHYDEEAGLGLALMRAYDLTSDARYLTTAETVYKDIMTQWDTTCCGTHLGGIWWDKAKTSKSTAANAGPALAGVRLAKRTGNSSYLDFAEKVYGFWWSEMVDAATFAVSDHLSTDGTVAAGALTDNYGLMLAAALELNSATGEAHYLTEANGFGAYLSAHGTKTSSAGPLLDDGSPCTGACAGHKGVGYRYLAELYQHDPTRTDLRDVLVGGATAVWTLARDSNTDFFNSVWAGPAPSSGAIEAQGSASTALNVYAMLCGTDANAAPSSPGVYEAEEGWLDHVDFEATKGRQFTGLGYVSAFTKDKQGVSIDVNVAKAGSYTLAWRYTAGEGAGSRVVVVNGTTQAQPLAFPATASWTAWTNVQSNAQLAAGKNTIGLFFDATKSSKTSLDIDQLIVTAVP